MLSFIEAKNHKYFGAVDLMYVSINVVKVIKDILDICKCKKANLSPFFASL